MTKKEFSSAISPGLIAGGVVVGTLLGAATAFFLTSDKNRPLKRELSDIYHQFHDKLNDLAHNLSEKSEGLRQGFSRHYFTKNPNRSRLNLLIGSLAGGVLGASAVFFLTTDSGKDIFEKAIEQVQCLAKKTHEIGEDIQEKTSEVIETFEDRVSTWADAAQNFISKLNGASKYGKNGSHHHSSAEKDIVDNVIDWASFGLRLYQSLKK
jgi:gas vesicle protein